MMFHCNVNQPEDAADLILLKKVIRPVSCNNQCLPLISVDVSLCKASARAAGGHAEEQQHREAFCFTKGGPVDSSETSLPGSQQTRNNKC